MKRLATALAATLVITAAGTAGGLGYHELQQAERERDALTDQVATLQARTGELEARATEADEITTTLARTLADLATRPPDDPLSDFELTTRIANIENQLDNHEGQLDEAERQRSREDLADLQEPDPLTEADVAALIDRELRDRARLAGSTTPSTSSVLDGVNCFALERVTDC